jgi:hypothetical protein
MIEQHPDYHQGFYDAQDMTPIWEDECTPEYRAGWFAYWNVHQALSIDGVGKMAKECPDCGSTSWDVHGFSCEHEKCPAFKWRAVREANLKAAFAENDIPWPFRQTRGPNKC